MYIHTSSRSYPTLLHNYNSPEVECETSSSRSYISPAAGQVSMLDIVVEHTEQLITYSLLLAVTWQKEAGHWCTAS